MFVSTRETAERPPHVDYAEAVLGGAPTTNKGLYVLDEIPQFALGELRALEAEPYYWMSGHVQDMLAPGIPMRLMKAITREAYSPDVFTKQQNGIVTPVEQIDDNLFVLRLGDGPTRAFKDVALQFLGRMMDHLLEVRGKHLDIVTATSGDTGSAAIEAVRLSDRLRIAVFSPKEGMTPVQAGQMGIRTDGEQVHNLRVDGNFDDCQDIVKAVMAEPAFAEHFGAMNSINWGRIAAQVPYSVAGYLQTIQQAGVPFGTPIDIVVPTGNFGDALSVYYAKHMGVPIRKVIIATNENDVMHRAIQTGVYSQGEVEVTTSPSMDIGKASNFERLVYEILGRDPLMTAAYMDDFETKGVAQFRDFNIGNLVLRLGGEFGSGASSHEARVRTIQQVYGNGKKYIIDPHTADGVYVAYSQTKRDIPTLVFSTADPVKFEGIIGEALGQENIPTRDPEFIGIERGLEKGFINIPRSVVVAKHYLDEHFLQKAA